MKASILTDLYTTAGSTLTEYKGNVLEHFKLDRKDGFSLDLIRLKHEGCGEYFMCLLKLNNEVMVVSPTPEFTNTKNGRDGMSVKEIIKAFNVNRPTTELFTLDYIRYPEVNSPKKAMECLVGLCIVPMIAETEMEVNMVAMLNKMDLTKCNRRCALDINDFRLFPTIDRYNKAKHYL